MPCMPSLMNDTEYKYQPLPLQGWNHIRLLELLPGTHPEPVSVILHDHRLAEDGPAFDSISYVWGDPTIRQTINCGDGFLSITQNLHDALTHFRFPDRSRLLWSDAACINQNDLDERASQVQLMHLIYKYATNCVVWLGPSDADSVAAAQIIRAMADIVCQRRNVTLDQLDAHLERQGREISLAQDMGFEGLPSRDSPSWASLMRFFGRKWFTRIWVVQEVSFARSVRFHCGADQMSWSALYHAADWIMVNSHRVDWYSILREDPHQPLSSRSSNIMAMRGESVERDGLRVDELLDKGKRFDATDARDKVYALMNFSAFRNDIPDMVPSYSASIAEVYTSATVAAIKGMKMLRILTYVDHSPDHLQTEKDFPLWVPRWHRQDKHPNVACVWYNFNRASGGEPLPLDTLQILNGPSPTLRLQGIEVDTIVDVCDIKQPLITERFHIFAPQSPWAPYTFHDPEDTGTSAMANAPYPAKPDIIDAYAMVLTSGCREHDGVFALDCNANENLRSATRVEFVAWLQRLRATQTATEAERLCPPGLYSTSQPNLPTDYDSQIEGWAEHFQTMLRVYTVGRRLFRTKKGYLGVGRWDVNTRDVVCVLLGGNVPFVLRRTEGRDATATTTAAEAKFGLVGEAYVHGIMGGELVEEWKGGSRSCRFFNLV